MQRNICFYNLLIILDIGKVYLVTKINIIMLI